MIFADRAQAGRQLATKLQAWRERKPIILGLPRGGVIVARAVAEALGAPLDVIVARKIGAPMHTELAIGAVTARGTRVLNHDALRFLALPPGYLDRETISQQREHWLRGTLSPLSLEGRTAILVDDGIATGMTMLAAIADVAALNPLAIVVAAPVIAPATMPALAAQADAIVALATPAYFNAVGEFYEDFSQTTDEQARGALISLGQPRRGRESK